MKRRTFFKNSILGSIGLSGLFGCSLPSTAASNIITGRKSLFKAIHITDMHIFSSEIVQDGIAQLISKIEEIKPDFVINTGDNIMDSLKTDKAEAIEQWEFWRDNFKSKLNYPLYNCIGNHDTWGWANTNADKSDEYYGKGLAMHYLDLKQRYYYYQHKGWHFIALDSAIYDAREKGYTARLDEEQFAWLEATLASIPKDQPVAITSHIPILAPCVYFDGDNEQSGDWHIPGAWMHIDARRIKDLLLKHPNVKCAFSGHVHLVDEARYLGVDYYCNGAACGGWWEGKYQEFGPLMAIIEFYDDGTVSNTMIDYQNA
ncbi:MAG: metallophosphoesterase [Carboxylicivirga sp.]|jgi:3',5'-cyclic AMP phosphodiesterase CpdA|nr:metallophosphoesterase [Carboxylicivirga sp.]